MKDCHGNLNPLSRLDFEAEQGVLEQSLSEASRDIDLRFDRATRHRLLAAKALRPSCLHYSGHGAYKEGLAFEKDEAPFCVPHWIDAGTLRRLIDGGDGPPFEFVFVSACHSREAGQTFAEAGVPHVVCCQQNAELKDSAARDFTYQVRLFSVVFCFVITCAHV